MSGKDGMSGFEVVFKSWIRVSLQSFVGDNPDSEYQRGYLAAVLDLAIECGMKNDPAWVSANQVLERTKGKA